MNALLGISVGILLTLGAINAAVWTWRHAGSTLRWLICASRGHSTIPLKRIGQDAFVVTCMRCGNVYLKTRSGDRHYEYTRYRGQFDNFDDYAVEQEEAEPKFVDHDGTNA